MLSAVSAPCWGPISLLLNIFGKRKKERIKKDTIRLWSHCRASLRDKQKPDVVVSHWASLCAGASWVFALYFHSPLNQTSVYLEFQWWTEALKIFCLLRTEGFNFSMNIIRFSAHPKLALDVGVDFFPQIMQKSWTWTGHSQSNFLFFLPSSLPPFLPSFLSLSLSPPQKGRRNLATVLHLYKNVMGFLQWAGLLMLW